MARICGQRWHHPSWFLVVSCLLTSLLVACGTTSTGNPTTSSDHATRTSAQPTPSPANVKLGSQPCPEAVQSATYWSPIVGVQPDVNKVEEVVCANLLGTSELQALVTVRVLGTGAALDLHVFTHILQPQPSELFKLLSLYKGSAKISAYNTLLTGEADANSSINQGANNNTNLQQDLFREFQWSGGAGTFVPVSFPGLYPDITRFQAEVDQQHVKQGEDAWKLDATKTAGNLAVNLLKWPSAGAASIVSGGGKNDKSAVVALKSPSVGSGTIQVTLSRLEGMVQGIWIVTGVSADGMAISSPALRDRISSPINVIGKGKAFEGVIGKVLVLDHTYTDIGDAQAKGVVGMGDTTFSVSVPYTPSFKNGTQEGILALFAYSNADGTIVGAVMQKVLIAA